MKLTKKGPIIQIFRILAGKPSLTIEKS